jgi:hypothetical protein
MLVAFVSFFRAITFCVTVDKSANTGRAVFFLRNGHYKPANTCCAVIIIFCVTVYKPANAGRTVLLLFFCVMVYKLQARKHRSCRFAFIFLRSGLQVSKHRLCKKIKRNSREMFFSIMGRKTKFVAFLFL